MIDASRIESTLTWLVRELWRNERDTSQILRFDEPPDCFNGDQTRASLSRVKDEAAL